MNWRNKEYKCIEDTEPNYSVGILSEKRDYNHELMNIPYMWRETMGAGVKTVILDTGIPIHIDLPKTDGKSFIPGYSIDKNGHATFIGGKLDGIAYNGMGVMGIAPDSEHFYGTVLGKNGSGSVRSIVEGILWAVDTVKADIVNLSLGVPGRARIGTELEDACNYARKKGVLLVAAAGNDGGKVNHPARYDSVVAVGAVGRNKRIARFSSRGTQIEFVAGGVDNYSTYLNNGYTVMSGTSFASPAIAGVAALILSSHRKKGRDLTPDEVIDHINRIAVRVHKNERSITGAGIPVFKSED